MITVAVIPIGLHTPPPSWDPSGVLALIFKVAAHVDARPRVRPPSLGRAVAVGPVEAGPGFCPQAASPTTTRWRYDITTRPPCFSSHFTIKKIIKNVLQDWQAPGYYFLNVAYYSTSGTGPSVLRAFGRALPRVKDGIVFQLLHFSARTAEIVGF